MDVCVLPASGPNFLAQLAILQHLCGDINYKPSLILGTSGGNLSAYIALAADFDSYAIERIARELKCDYFIQAWHAAPLISYIIGFFNGNMFKEGSGMHDFLKLYFTKASISAVEIWCSAYNKDLQKLRLFTNKSKFNSLLEEQDLLITQCMTPYYCNGNLKKIADAGISSASIPGVRSGQIIDGHEYIDGAVCGSSPLTMTQGLLLNMGRKNNLHIIYVNSKDLSATKILPHHNVIDTYKQAVADLIKSQSLIDRLVAFELLKSLSDGQPIQYETFPCSSHYLNLYNEKKKHIQYSLLEIYPIVSTHIDMANFTGEDIVKNMKSLYTQCHCNFWWF